MITLSEKLFNKIMLSLFLLLESFKKVSYFVCRRRNISILTPIFFTEFFLVERPQDFYYRLFVLQTVNVMLRVLLFTGL